MVGVNFFGNFDLASLSIWLFWLFFAYLVYYLQTENMREGYPLEDEDGNVTPNQGPFPLPADKTFKRSHGQPDLTVPSGARKCRDDLALVRTNSAGGFPLAPTGHGLSDGVGPASWAPREETPELDAHGHPKISPMAGHADFFVSAGRDPRGMAVLSQDDKVVGHVTDMWIDPSEHMVRYLEYTFEPEWGGGTALVPIGMARIMNRWVLVKSLKAKDFNGVPRHAGKGVITKREEDQISGYYAGGILYS